MKIFLILNTAPGYNHYRNTTPVSEHPPKITPENKKRKLAIKLRRLGM